MDEKKPITGLKVTGVSLIDPKHSVTGHMVFPIERKKPVPLWKKIFKWIGVGLGAVAFVFIVSARVIFGRGKNNG